MKHLLVNCIFCISILHAYEVLSQNPPVGILPMQFNPSFAGSAGNARLISNFSYGSSKKWGYKNYGSSLSYDNYFPKIRSGIGLTTNANTQQTTNGNYKNHLYDLSLIVAPKISIRGKYTISPSLQFTFNDYYYKYKNGPIDIQDAQRQLYQGGAGVLFNTTDYFIGYSLLIYQSEKLENNTLNYLFSAFQVGYVFRKDINSKFSFTPQIIIPLVSYLENYIDWPAYNLGFKYDNYTFGVVSEFQEWHPSGFLFAWQNENFRLILSNEFVRKTYTGNISVRYLIAKKTKAKHIPDPVY
jgi:hypothetical protein